MQAPSIDCRSLRAAPTSTLTLAATLRGDPGATSIRRCARQMMRPRLACLAVAAIAVALTPRAALPKSAAQGCTDASRACLIEVAHTYLTGLELADGSKVRLAPTVRRTQNGAKLVEEGEAALRRSIARERLTGRRNMRLLVDEAKRTVFAFWLTGTSLPDTPSSHVAERIKVENGLITEIEVFWVQDKKSLAEATSGWPDETLATSGPSLPPAPTRNAAALAGCTDARRDCLYAVARSYLDALMVADGSKVRFAAHVRRTQNGGLLQEGEATLRASVAREKLMFRHNFRMYADEHTSQVVAIWVTGSTVTGQPSTAHVIERLRIADGKISEIEVFYPRDEGTLEGKSGWPDEPEN